MSTSKLVIKKSFIKKDGKTPVYIQYIFSSEQKATINTGIEIYPKHWNPLTQSIKEKAADEYDENYSILNANLSKQLADFKLFIGRAIHNNIVPNIAYVNTHYKQFLQEKKSNLLPIPAVLSTIYDHIDDYIKLKNDNVASDTIKDYNSLKKHLKQFENSITLNWGFIHLMRTSMRNLSISFFSKLKSLTVKRAY